jgi:hypothetical protein
VNSPVLSTFLLPSNISQCKHFPSVHGYVLHQSPYYGFNIYNIYVLIHILSWYVQHTVRIFDLVKLPIVTGQLLIYNAVHRPIARQRP